MSKLLLSTTTALIIALSLVRPASAAVYNYTLSGFVHGSGTLTTGAGDNGGFDIIGITGTITCSCFAVDQTITDLVGGNPGSGGSFSPSGLFFYDNILYPTQNPLLDNGLVFSTTGLPEIHLFSGAPSTYGIEGDVGGFVNLLVFGEDFTITAVVPEPASITMMGTSLIVLGLMMGWRYSKAVNSGSKLFAVLAEALRFGGQWFRLHAVGR